MFPNKFIVSFLVLRSLLVYHGYINANIGPWRVVTRWKHPFHHKIYQYIQLKPLSSTMTPLNEALIHYRQKCIANGSKSVGKLCFAAENLLYQRTLLFSLTLF